MSKKYQKSLFIFRRDYRLNDNTALIKACAESESVVPVFCFDPNQYDADNNKYFGANSFRFLIESLRDLDDQLSKFDYKLHFLDGLPWEKIPQLAVAESCDAVFWNDDYTPYALQRDANTKSVLENKSIQIVTTPDVLLTVPGSVCTGSGGPYKVFTPFMRKAREQGVPDPVEFSADNLIRVRGDILETKDILDTLDPGGKSSRQVGGRTSALRQLGEIIDLHNYAEVRNFPAEKGTSELSAHLKFGTLSVREVYKKVVNSLSGNSQLITELYWRDFYMHVLHAFPYVLGDEFQEKYQGMSWEGVGGIDSQDLLDAWQQGKTGFPIVDAGMRQLLTEGWMHNRVRMIVASFLTKDLHLDWREGEQWFAKNLVDYDPASNNGGWQWAASTGTDAQPFFRIFNPWSQQKKFDPDCVYVKKYIPELQNLDPKIIHKLGEYNADKLVELLEGTDYHRPIVDHAHERQLTLEYFKDITS